MEVPGLSAQSGGQRQLERFEGREDEPTSGAGVKTEAQVALSCPPPGPLGPKEC